MKELLLNYTSYNLWANTRIIVVLKDLDVSLLDKELKSSFPTIKKTLCHIWGAEEIWLKRLQGVEQPTATGFTFSGNTNEAIDSWKKTSASFNEFVYKNEEAYFQSNNTYKDLKGNSYTSFHWQMIMHCMNHSSYHRGQIVTMLREVGVTTIPSTDLIGYFRERK